MKYTAEVHFQSPSLPESWNMLAVQNGNLLQHTCYDQVQSFYCHRPVYFQVTGESGSLVAGCRCYLWESRKLGRFSGTLSRNLLQFGEILFAQGLSWEQKASAKATLTEVMHGFARGQRVVTFKASGYYGRPELLLEFPVKQVRTPFGVAVIDLTTEEERLWASLHLMHRRNIRKAAENKLDFVRETDPAAFFRLLDNTYDVQEVPPPNRKYIENLCKVLIPDDHADIFCVRDQDEYLAAALVTRCGTSAFYAFGGNRKNNLGAGAFLHWNIIKYFKNKGFDRYYLGQIQPGNSEVSPKFAGITSFKRNFCPLETESASVLYICRSLRYRCWRLLLKLFVRT